MQTPLTKVIGLGSVALALALASSCGSSTKSGQSPTTTSPPAASTTAPPTSVTPTIVPTTSLAPTSTTTTPTPATMDVRVYFMRGDTIDVAHRTITSTRQVATAAMTELLAGPSPSDRTAGLATFIPSSTHLLGINIANGIATVDLSAAFSGGGGSLSMTGRLAQVTYTMTQFPTVTGVVFELDGTPVTVFGGEGIILDHPATRASFESVTPPILVESPGRGWSVHTPLRITGTANVFEAQFRAELTDSRGQVIATQSIHATSGTGTRGSFDSSIVFAGSATGPATLTVFDISPKDGARVDVVTVPLELAGGIS